MGLKNVAQFSWSMQIIKRSSGRSVVAASAYRAGEKLHDERQQMTHDYSRRAGVEHTEILGPDGAPSWVFDREALWNRVEDSEKRKDAQVARELRIMIPRELSEDVRIALVRDYVSKTFVARGMVADVAWHNKTASDGLEQPHAHVLLTMRPLGGEGFGKKSRHDWVHHPDGLKNSDGSPVLVMSNTDSWNSTVYFEGCREAWERMANGALADSGSEARIDRRSLLERGLARMPEPALRMAWYMRDLYGCMKQRFGQYLASKHFQTVEGAAKTVLTALEKGDSRAAHAVQTAERFYSWFDRQIERLSPPPDGEPDPQLIQGIKR